MQCNHTQGILFYCSKLLTFGVPNRHSIFFFTQLLFSSNGRPSLKPDISKPGTEVKLRGAHNLIFLVMIVAAVILSGTLPSMPQFQDAAGKALGHAGTLV